MGCCPKCGWEGSAQYQVGGPLKHYDSFEALQVIQGVGSLVIRLELWHLEIGRNRFLHGLCQEWSSMVNSTSLPGSSWCCLKASSHLLKFAVDVGFFSLSGIWFYFVRDPIDDPTRQEFVADLK